MVRIEAMPSDRRRCLDREEEGKQQRQEMNAGEAVPEETIGDGAASDCRRSSEGDEKKNQKRRWDWELDTMLDYGNNTP